MPDMHLRQPGFTYSACGSFTKTFLWKRFFIKTSATCRNKFAGCSSKNENIWNKVLAEEFHEPIFRKLKNEKYTHFL